jgi:antitoxin YefM
MKVVTYSYARNNLRSLIDTVCATDEEVLITTQGDQTVMMISLDEYNRTHADVRRSLRRSLEQIDAGDVIGIDEAFANARQHIQTLAKS